MTVKRQYTLPYCNLILEGLSANANDPLSPLTVLMNAECQLPGATDASLTGGREFLDSLVTAVSRYGQQVLSGVSRPLATPGTPPPMVDLKPGESSHQHHLVVRQQPLGASTVDTEALPPLDIPLTTVQFYDLMEAVDQLLADTQTLPDLTAQIQSVSRRLVKPAEPVAKRAAPAALGAAALAAAGLALFFVPPPEFEPTRPDQESDTPAETSRPIAPETPPLGADPETDAPESATSETEPADAEASNNAALIPAPDPTEAEDSETEAEANTGAVDEEESTEADTATAPSLSLDGEADDAPSTLPPRSPANSTAGLPPLEDTISQGDRIRQLNDLLRGNIAERLEPLDADTELTYRVRLTANGDIVGYEPLNATSARWASDTPIPDLVSTFRGSPEQADFRVVLTENGVLQVSPWDGWPQ